MFIRRALFVRQHDCRNGGFLVPLVLLFLASFLFPFTNAEADFQASLTSIVPDTTAITDDLPPVPLRQSIFGWQGAVGQSYVITFQATSEPSLVMGVGCRVISTSYDAMNTSLQVVVEYQGEQILVDDAIELPSQTFLVILDPGVDSTQLASFSSEPSAKGPGAKESATSTGCYGPGADPSLYRDESGDFGDDNGLNDPADGTEDTSATTVGLPFEAAGSFGSTNTFYWCVIPTQAGVNRVGFGLVGAKSSLARLDFFLSAGLLSFLSGREGKSVTAANLAIFSGTQQVSIDVDAEDDGARATLRAKLERGLTTVDTSDTAAQSVRAVTRLPAKARHVPASRRRAAARRGLSLSVSADDTTSQSDDLVRRSILFGVREPVSVSPQNNQVTTKAVSFFGFVDDPTLAGRIIEIVKTDEAPTRCTVGSSAVTGKIIASAPIASDGSWNVKIPTTAVFSNNKKKATVVAQVQGDATRQSREISLSNANRNNRR